MDMDRSFLESLFAGLQNPARVCVKWYDNKYYYVESEKQTNDTLDWYDLNSNQVEEGLAKGGYSWCYVFETAPGQSPVIYMFFAKGLTKEALAGELGEIAESLPEDRNLFFEDKPFSAIDVEQYDNSVTAFEQELSKRARDVFRVYEP